MQGCLLKSIGKCEQIDYRIKDINIDRLKVNLLGGIIHKI